MFYVKWKEPQDVQWIVGKAHFVRSLRTGRLNEAVRTMRIVGYEFERWLGFAAFIEQRRQSGKRKLFPELTRAPNGSYGKEFSKWYGRFMRQIGVQKAGDKTCYHSYRHVFRDALRSARIDHEVGLALGGWTNSTKGEVHANYGSGHGVRTLKLAIDRIEHSATRGSFSCQAILDNWPLCATF